MASKLSAEQLQLVKWRLEHGETVSGQGRVETFLSCEFYTSRSAGRPFYDDPKFAKWEPQVTTKLLMKIIITSMKCKEGCKQIKFPCSWFDPNSQVLRDCQWSREEISGRVSASRGVSILCFHLWSWKAGEAGGMFGKPLSPEVPVMGHTPLLSWVLGAAIPSHTLPLRILFIVRVFCRVILLTTKWSLPNPENGYIPIFEQIPKFWWILSHSLNRVSPQNRIGVFWSSPD